ncbi:hypothetical protein LIS82_22375 [Cytobacillus solani]|uniref:Uncharacterized protein n=1 Tax=Cytobacillus solani TaxID=1637975 RepID=A0A0Q3VIL2_9BACI|nr:hypothetical protein [Cytobacillus solani]KOP84088.1 hypothetical protein AMS60_00065 [Bacillus sp. FJAT-21945]KQL21023.1 hypothetical protein AN957_22250 [Cytobacillus solani]USK54271.1 hypothetical protein LIS82_22375 [Cytobacillus solani]
MKKLSESELSFQELNEIPRSSRQKQQTFQKIKCEISRESDTKRRVFPKILTGMVSLAACFLFVFIIFTETNLNNRTSLMASIEGKEIVQMGLASSKLGTSFLPGEEENQKNTFIIKDDNWSEIVFEMLKNAEISTIKPITDPSYDLLITLQGPDLLKIKVWEEKGEVYLRELNKDKYYYVPKEKSKVFLEYVHSLNHYITKPI